YGGRVGTGFSSGVAEALFAQLDTMRIRSSPFARRLTTAEARQGRFVKPGMKPLLRGRALALVRCPDGIGGQTFFQKHAWKGLNRNIVLVKDPEEPEPLISIRDFDGLMALVQSAALEIHPWGSTVTDWERPDMIVMDLDPGDDVDWTSVIAAAEEVRA